MQRLMDTPARCWPRWRARRALRRLAPDLLAGVTPERLRDALQAPARAQAGARASLLDHVAPVRISVRDAVDELSSELPRGRAGRFRR